MYIIATLGLAALTAGVYMASSNSLHLSKFAKASTIYKHYNSIFPDDDEHGCVEFWVSCSDYSYTLEEPTGVTIIEGGDITDNPSFDWDGMNILDDRYLPSFNESERWGMSPTYDSSSDRILYGLYPQTAVEDETTYNALEALTSDDIYEQNGYYYYNGNFYQNCIGDACDGDSHFASGTKVKNGTRYWFLCERISWVTMYASGSYNTVYSEKLLNAGVQWGHSNTDVYGTSLVRDWLNGVGTHSGNGFMKSAFSNDDTFLESMQLSLDDGSSTLNDYVRLLTKAEAKNSANFVNDGARKANITDWAAAHHACFQRGDNSFGRWWLCEGNTEITEDYNTTHAWGVGLGGAVGQGGPKTGTASGDRCERPVVTIVYAY